MGCSLRIVACAVGMAAAITAAAYASEERLSPGFAGDPGALLAEAERVMNAAPKRALELTSQILDHSDAPLDAESLARVHYVRARASTNAGRHDEAIAESELSLELLADAAPALRSDILTTMSISLGRSRETRRAFELQQDALALKRGLGDLAGEATSLSALAELYFDIGHTQKGVATFTEAVAVARRANDPRVLAVTLNNFAYFLQREGDYARATLLIDEALGLIGRVDSPRLDAYVLLTAAGARYRIGRPAEAMALIARGLPIAEEHSQTILLSSANLVLARLARDQGALEDARAYAERSLGFARELNSERHLSDVTRFLADINEELGDHQAAYGYLRGHAAHLAAAADSAAARSAALFDAETLLAARDQEMELLRRDSEIDKLAVARAVILRNAAALGALLLGAGLAALALLFREKARAKRSMELKNRELTSAYEKLEAANRNKSTFLSVMSHELKTPLNAIIGFSDILRRSETVSASSAVEFAKIINLQGRNLLRMVSEILLFTSAGDQQMALDETVESVEDIIQQSVCMSEEIREGAGLRIDVGPMEPGVAISCDIDQLANGIARILDNALKFSPVMSRVSLMAARNAAGELEIVVGDEGPGVADAEIPRVFDILTQGDRSLARSQPGAGLGLPIANRIATAHGGRIGLARKPSGGTTVTVVLPASRVVAAAGRAAA